MRSGFFFWLLSALSVGMVPLAVSCGSEPSGTTPRPLVGDDDVGDDDTTREDGGTLERDGGGSLPEGSTTGGRVYAHTTDTLYLFEPTSRTLKEIGKFSCLEVAENVIDIAVDRAGNMFATTFDRFLSVNPVNAQCTELAFASTEIDYPNALSFVPAGTVDPSKEALVGYAGTLTDRNNATNYVRIDTATGVMTPLGDINKTDAGTQYRSSGDIISLIQDGKRAYATIHLKNVASTVGTDLLAEIDPKNGNILRVIGDTKENQLYGFGYWNGKGYGFNGAGRVVEIDMNNGSSIVVKTLAGDGGGAIPWYGAGVTTQAPVLP
ncbi:MAG: hypothetical protein JST00_29110 [Deltaproteobacteria bacterium]|nr:hypothetical protein [Deltaproteobacteria bacterium]